MVRRAEAEETTGTRRAWLAAVVAGAAALLSACAGSGISVGDIVPNQSSPPPAAPAQAAAAIGTGKVKVGVVLPMSAGGNAGVAAQAMKNAAELALAEFNNPDIQLLVKDDGGTAQGAQQAVQQALDEGAEIILGPLFAHSVGVAGQTARARNVPVIAFSNDSNVAARGVYLLSFLPESDVDRIVSYAVSQGKRSFAALLPDNAYGTVAEATFKQAVARKGGRVVALERFPLDRVKLQETAKVVAQATLRADALFIPCDADTLPVAAQSLAASGVDFKRLVLLGTGLWDDTRVFSDNALQGGLYAAPDSAGFRNFSTRYRAKYGNDPVRTAALAYDAVALVAALVKTQGPQRFSNEVLTNPSGFSGIDGVFRFRQDGTNERGLSVLRVTPSGGQVVSPAPRALAGT
jgi:ABC-type branched-subunit amino acid transport system substrate-binding protein